MKVINSQCSESEESCTIVKVHRLYSINPDKYIRGFIYTLESVMKDKYGNSAFNYTLGQNYTLSIDYCKKFEYTKARKVSDVIRSMDNDVRAILKIYKKEV